jgi:hypothetical protein
MTFDQFLDKADKFYYENEFELRHGQSIMNVLYLIRPDLHKNIIGTDFDCFYDDGTVAFTLHFLERIWDDKNI